MPAAFFTALQQTGFESSIPLLCWCNIVTAVQRRHAEHAVQRRHCRGCSSEKTCRGCRLQQDRRSSSCSNKPQASMANTTAQHQYAFAAKHAKHAQQIQQLATYLVCLEKHHPCTPSNISDAADRAVSGSWCAAQQQVTVQEMLQGKQPAD